MTIPQYWKDFIIHNALDWKEIEIPEHIDHTGIGAVFEILDEKSICQEAEDFYPGITVSRDGFVPVGSCSIGSGDPYFINQHDGVRGPLYRIYHDMVNEDGYERSQAVEVVISDYTEILNYIVAP